MKTVRSLKNGDGFTIAVEARPGQGEDHFAARTGPEGGFLCVADGCGGSGSRRYAALGSRTEACFASQIAVEYTRQWACRLCKSALPLEPAAVADAAAALAKGLYEQLSDFQKQHREHTCSKIIMRGLSRSLPTTLCAALMDARAPGSIVCRFFWAGDSRGYVLNTHGLRQCTADHSVGRPDPMESLYSDARLANMVNADGPFTIDTFGLTIQEPCVVIAATDGVFGYLPTPMEFELLLLRTLQSAKSLRGWRRRLTTALGKTAGDDATLSLACFGADTFEALQRCIAGRRAAFQARFVTPVRRHGQNVDFAYARWMEYRQNYEACREAAHVDRRL